MTDERETAAMTGGERLDALNGRPIAPLTDAEAEVLRTVAAWYAARCVEIGVEPPTDILRCILACAHEVVSYNVHLAAMGHPNARPPETRH